jgi:hypothetical protein
MPPKVNTPSLREPLFLLLDLLGFPIQSDICPSRYSKVTMAKKSYLSKLKERWHDSKPEDGKKPHASEPVVSQPSPPLAGTQLIQSFSPIFI